MTRQEIIEGLVSVQQQHAWQEKKGGAAPELEMLASYIEELLAGEVEKVRKALAEVTDLLEQCLSPEVREVAKELMRLKALIIDAVQWLDPECPDAEAYVDGHCDLVSSARKLREDSDTLKQLRDALSLVNRSSV